MKKLKLDASTIEALDLLVYCYAKKRITRNEMNYQFGCFAEALDCHPNELMAAFTQHT